MKIIKDTGSSPYNITFPRISGIISMVTSGRSGAG